MALTFQAYQAKQQRSAGQRRACVAGLLALLMPLQLACTPERSSGARSSADSARRQLAEATSVGFSYEPADGANATHELMLELRHSDSRVCSVSFHVEKKSNSPGKAGEFVLHSPSLTRHEISEGKVYRSSGERDLYRDCSISVEEIWTTGAVVQFNFRQTPLGPDGGEDVLFIVPVFWRHLPGRHDLGRYSAHWDVREKNDGRARDRTPRDTGSAWGDG